MTTYSFCFLGFIVISIGHFVKSCNYGSQEMIGSSTTPLMNQNGDSSQESDILPREENNEPNVGADTKSIFQPVMDLTTNIEGVDFIKEMEGYSEKVYSDYKNRLPTVGYGTNCKANPAICHDLIPESGRVDRAIAEKMLRRQLTENVERTIRKGVKVPLSQNQYNALSSFIYHEGSGNFQSSTLLKKLNEGNAQGAAEEFRQWNRITNPKTGKKEISGGFVNRREKEIQLFCKNGECDPNKGKLSQEN